MSKRIIALLFAVLLSVATIVPAFATSETPPRFVDEAELVDDTLDAELTSLLDEISERQQFDVVVCTINSLDGTSPESYADDYYDYNGYGYGEDYDGALLLVAIEEGQWYISTCGYGITALTDAGIEYIGEQIVPSLSDGEYYDAFVTYAELCDEFVTQAKNGDAYDVDNIPKAPFNVLKSLFISLIVGLVVALIVTLIMKSQLKSVRFKSAAEDYEKPGSMKVTDAREFFLYRNVSRQKKVQNSSGGSSTHRSSSGRIHGGGGGRF